MLSDPALVVSRLVFVGLAIEAVEVLLARRELAEGGLFSRSSMGLLAAGAPWPEPLLVGRGGAPAMARAMAAQLAAAATVVAVGLGHPAGVAGALVCLGTAAYLRARRPIGGSGADQLAFIVLAIVALVWAAGGTEEARWLGDLAIAGQVVLAYLTAGVAKAVSPLWRSGRAMAAIVSAEGYGSAPVAALLRRLPGLDRVTCWAVMGWEVTFPAVLFLPAPGVAAYLAVGAAFHVACAVVMGLNRFVWSFCGCYPAVWAVAVVGWPTS